MTTKEKRQEIHYWNCLKTVAILLVVFCHLPRLHAAWYNNYAQLLTFMAVPLFFMVNGAALFHSAFDFNKHMKKMLHLFAVTTVWRLVYLLFAAWQRMADVSAVKPQKLVAYFLGASIKGVPSGPLWFMRVLLACYLIFPLLKCVFDIPEKRKYLWLLCAAMFVLMILTQEILFVQEALTAQGWIGEKAGLNLSFLTRYNPINEWAVLYFLLGGLLHQRYSVEGRGVQGGARAVCVLTFLAGSVWFFVLKGLIAGFSGTVFNDFSKYGIDGCYQALSLLVMVWSVFALASGLPFRSVGRNRLWSLVGRNTLGIYYLHYLLSYLLITYVPYFRTHAGVWCNSLKTLLVVGAGLGIGMLAKKIPGVRKLFT